MVEDINYLAQQSSDSINIILSGMMALMSDTDSKVAMLESQKWFQRMVKTIFGKNKLTQTEIQQNHEKLNAYMSEAIAELYNRNCINQKVIMSLGTQLNELYANNVQLKQMLGAFVNKLNLKIDSIDNFHMLVTEIDQGVYCEDSPLISICKLIAQFDNRILEDQRKLDIISRSLIEQKIITQDSILLTDYLREILDMPVDKFGEIYLELNTMRDNFMADIIIKTMNKYYFLPDLSRKVKNKDILIKEVIKEERLDDTVTLSIDEIYNNFVDSKIALKTNSIPVKQLLDEPQFDECDDCDEADYEEVHRDLPLIGGGKHKAVQYNIAVCYHDGCGTIRDDRKAKKWLIKSAQQGYYCAQIKLKEWYGEDYSK